VLPPYEVVPGGDPAVVAYGATLPELFEHAALAMFDLIFDLDGVPPRHSRPVTRWRTSSPPGWRNSPR
jgi:hypothetical protein